MAAASHVLTTWGSADYATSQVAAGAAVSSVSLATKATELKAESLLDSPSCRWQYHPTCFAGPTR